MSVRSQFHPASVLAVASAVLSFAMTSSPAAGPVVALGGGVATQNFTDRQSVSVAPSLALRREIADSWAVFMRVGYERHSVPVGTGVCLGTGCPTSAAAKERVTYVPAGLGVRFSAAPRPSPRTGGYLELASSIVWTRFEDDVELGYNDGRRLRILRSSDHWLAEVGLGAGFQYRLSGTLGAELGLRYAYRRAPRGTYVTESVGVERGGFTIVSVVAALTLAP